MVGCGARLVTIFRLAVHSRPSPRDMVKRIHGPALDPPGSPISVVAQQVSSEPLHRGASAVAPPTDDRGARRYPGISPPSPRTRCRRFGCRREITSCCLMTSSTRLPRTCRIDCSQFRVRQQRTAEGWSIGMTLSSVPELRCQEKRRPCWRQSLLV